MGKRTEGGFSPLAKSLTTFNPKIQAFKGILKLISKQRGLKGVDNLILLNDIQIIKV